MARGLRKAVAAGRGGAGRSPNSAGPHGPALEAFRQRDFRALFALAGSGRGKKSAFAQFLLAVAFLTPERAIALGERLLARRSTPPPIRRLILEKLAIAQTKTGQYARADEIRAQWQQAAGVSARSAALLAASLSWQRDPSAALGLLREAEVMRGGLGESYRLMAAMLTLELEGADAAEARWETAPVDSADAGFVAYNIALQRHRILARESLAQVFDGFGLVPPVVRPHETVDVNAFSQPLAGAPIPPREGSRLVTVVVTAYNAAATIAAALASLQADAHRALDIIVVDDCSTDATAELVTAMAGQDRRIRLLRNRRNLGTYLSRNRAMLQARGEFVTFHDADDWSHPERIGRHLATMDAQPSLVMTRSHWIRMAPDGTVVLRRWSRSFAHTNPSSLFLRTGWLDRLGYFDAVRADGDYEYARRIETILEGRQIATLPVPLAIGFVHEASLTRSGATALDREYHSPARSAYKQAWIDSYPRRIAAGTLPRPALAHGLPYEIPPQLAVDLADLEDWFAEPV